MHSSKLRLTERILELSNEITRLLGRYEGLSGVKPEPKLRKRNRIKTIQGSLAIEGNSLSWDQVTAVLDGKRVLGPKRDILEVQNAIQAYQLAGEFDPYSIRSMLEAHGVLMNGILPDAGKWRTGAVGIMKGSRVSHLAPKAQLVQGMIKDLLKSVKTSNVTPLISSSVFHHEFEFIHPFSDGNGRMGRLWQHILLTRFHEMFEFIPIETAICERQSEYYQSLEQADRAADSAVFVEFMLDAILEATKGFMGEIKVVVQATPEDRLRSARDHFRKAWFSRKDYHAFFVRFSAPTASRDLKLGVDLKLLERSGDKALARYRFRG